MPRRPTDPYASFNFKLTIEGIEVAGFSECTGMNMESTPIEYREGNEKVNTVRKLPGLMKYGNITLKQGVTENNQLIDWLNTVRDGDVRRLEKSPMSIELQKEDHTKAMSWKLINAWPVKWTGPDLKANADEVAIESLEICHEGLERE